MKYLSTSQWCRIRVSNWMNIFSISRKEPKWFLNQQVPKKWFSNFFILTHYNYVNCAHRHCWIYYFYYSLFPSHFSSITRHTANRQTDSMYSHDVYDTYQGRWIIFFGFREKPSNLIKKNWFYVIFLFRFISAHSESVNHPSKLNVR